jgi:hypothetical protein
MRCINCEKSLSKGIPQNTANCKTAEREYQSEKWLKREAKIQTIIQGISEKRLEDLKYMT